jgi:hypothetical protein
MQGALVPPETLLAPRIKTVLQHAGDGDSASTLVDEPTDD